MSQLLLNILVRALMVFTVFPVRQYARNRMAVKLGDDTPVLEGKLTLNPFAHMDLMGCIFMMLLGFGWGKSASIDPRKFKTKNPRLAMIAVALAGPAANLLLALILVFGVMIAGYAGINNAFVQIFASIALLNIRLAVFLLLPVPGFDGWDILMMFLPVKFIWRISRYIHYIPLIVILLVYAGPLGSFIDIISSEIISLMTGLASAVLGVFFR